jgi:hypothetical protein
MGPSYQKTVFRCKTCGCTFLHDGLFLVLKCPRCVRKIGKVSEISGDLIDAYEKKLESMNSDAAFNDKHLVSIIEVSAGKLLCSKDEEAMSYIKNKDFYETASPPKIYTGSRNRDLLNHTNMAKLRNVV